MIDDTILGYATFKRKPWVMLRFKQQPNIQLGKIMINSGIVMDFGGFRSWLIFDSLLRLPLGRV
jgi:hypothetical protein